MAVCAAADDKSGLDRPQRLTGYESRPGRSVGRPAVVTAELGFHSSLWRRHSSRFGVAIPRLCPGGHAGKEKIGAAPAAVLALNGAQQLDRLVVGESADDREIAPDPTRSLAQEISVRIKTRPVQIGEWLAALHGVFEVFGELVELIPPQREVV